MKTRNLLLTAGLLAGAATLQRMIREIQRDRSLSRPTATILDGLYVAHLAEVWRRAHDDRDRLPVSPVLARTLGGGVAALGAVVMAAGMAKFPSEAQINAQRDEELITDGIYRYSRHPQYAGWTLLLTGLGLARRSPRALALAAIYPAAVRYWLPHEEAHLEDVFGQGYAQYRDCTPRWLGSPSVATTP